MENKQPDFTVPTDISLQLRRLGLLTFDTEKGPDFKSIKWDSDEAHLTSDSPIVREFKTNLSSGEKIFFINIDKDDGLNSTIIDTHESELIITEDFSIIYENNKEFDYYFDSSIFGSRRIISSLKNKFIIADFNDWGLLLPHTSAMDQR